MTLRHRHLLITGAAFALWSTAASAAPAVLPIFFFAKDCVHKAQHIDQVQCAIQVVEGDRNKIMTKQTTVYSGHGRSLQLAITYQDGDGNRAHTEQIGEDQFSLTAQVGNGNSAYTFQKGDDQFSTTIQKGDGQWAATSSIGHDTSTSVYQSN
jgi:hypothetical protein